MYHIIKQFDELHNSKLSYSIFKNIIFIYIISKYIVFLFIYCRRIVYFISISRIRVEFQYREECFVFTTTCLFSLFQRQYIFRVYEKLQRFRMTRAKNQMRYGSKDTGHFSKISQVFRKVRVSKFRRINYNCRHCVRNHPKWKNWPYYNKSCC